jgi:hypothetical protein
MWAQNASSGIYKVLTVVTWVLATDICRLKSGECLQLVTSSYISSPMRHH